MRKLLDGCMDLYFDLITDPYFPYELTEPHYGLIMDIKKKLDSCYYVCKTGYVIKYDPGQPRGENGRWIDAGGGSGNSSGETAYYAGLKDKLSALKDKVKNKTTPDKYKEVSEKYLDSLPKRAEQESMEQSLMATNPFGYDENCQRCVPAYEMRRRGYDVIAKDAPENHLDDSIGFYDYKKVFVGMQWKSCSGTGYEEITDYLQKCGNGARVEITIDTNKGNHIFVAEQVGKTTVFIDPQRNTDKADKYFKMSLTAPTKYCRIDNLKPSNLIKDCIGV